MTLDSGKIDVHGFSNTAHPDFLAKKAKMMPY